MAGLKKFLFSVSKIASIISLVILIVLGVVWVCSIGLEKYREKEVAPLAAMKTWDTLKVSQFKSKLILRTKWKPSKLSYRLFIRLNDSTDVLPKIASIDLVFQDKDGFTLFENKILHDEMISSLTGEEGGKILGYSVDKSVFMPQKDYASATSWTINWIEQ